MEGVERLSGVTIDSGAADASEFEVDVDVVGIRLSFSSPLTFLLAPVTVTVSSP